MVRDLIFNWRDIDSLGKFSPRRVIWHIGDEVMNPVVHVESFLRSVMVVGLVLVVAACSRGIYAPQDIPIAASKPLTTDQVQQLILNAGKNGIWDMEPKAPNRVLASKKWGGSGAKHQIAISIVHDNDSYSINYVSSQNLGYDGNSIHRSYNRFVTELEGLIAAEAASL